MFHNILIFITFSFIFVSFSHAAEETKNTPYGLAMHGNPKYSSQSKYLDYANPDAPKSGHLKIAAIGSFDTLNPYTLKGTPARGLNLAYDKLMARIWDEPFTMYPQIARSYALPPDRSWISFTIDPRARFHDGRPTTAQDVKFSFETLREFGRPNMRRIYKLVKNVEITNNNTTITFTFGEGADRETPMIIAMMPILSKSYWSDREFNTTTLDHPLTNGPYRIQSVDPGHTITYTRNPDYWAADLLPNKGHYNFDKITYEYFRDDTVALESFNKGDLNFRHENDIAKWMNAYKDEEKTIKYSAPHKRPERVKAMIFNTRRAPFNDVNIRKAMALAFDEEWIRKNIYYGQAHRIKSFFPNSSLATPHRKESPPPATIRQKIKMANSLLKESGWIIENGKRTKDGKPLEFEIILSAPKEEKIALNFKKHLERLGIVMNIRVLDSAAFQTRRQNYDYDMILHHWQNSLSPGTEQILYWSCQSANQPGRFNYTGICDANIDQLTHKIADAKTYDDLTTLAHALDKALLDQHLIIPLFYKGADHIAHRPHLFHPETIPIYGSVTETWWMDGNKHQNMIEQAKKP